jgi:hypothetical protein
MKNKLIFPVFSLMLLIGCADVVRNPPAAPAIASTPSESQAIVAPTPLPAANTLGTPRPQVEAAEQGLILYKTLYCGLCHELQAANTKGIFGPPHNDMGTIAAQRVQDPAYTGQATTAEDYLYESLVQPEVYIVEGYAASRHRMPSYAHLTPPDLDALTQFLLQQ